MKTRSNPRVASLPFPEPSQTTVRRRLRRPLQLDAIQLADLRGGSAVAIGSTVTPGGGTVARSRQDRTGSRPAAGDVAGFARVARAGLLLPAARASAAQTSAAQLRSRGAEPTAIPRAGELAEVSPDVPKTDRSEGMQLALLLDLCGAGLLMALVLLAAILV